MSFRDFSIHLRMPNYTPTRPGVYNVVVFYDNIQIDGSPFKVTVDVDGE